MPLPVPVHGSTSIKRGTLGNILRTAGISREDSEPPYELRPGTGRRGLQEAEGDSGSRPARLSLIVSCERLEGAADHAGVHLNARRSRLR
jgi:hypothetical protein